MKKRQADPIVTIRPLQALGVREGRGADLAAGGRTGSGLGACGKKDTFRSIGKGGLGGRD